jgi:hypothetical protein
MKHHKNHHKQASNGESNPDLKKIKHRAYELYLDRGSDPGHDFDDRLRAEHELNAKGEGAPSKILV